MAVIIFGFIFLIVSYLWLNYYQQEQFAGTTKHKIAKPIFKTFSVLNKSLFYIATGGFIIFGILSLF